MITEAPYTFLIEGKLIFNPLKNSDIGLAYSNMPTKIRDLKLSFAEIKKNVFPEFSTPMDIRR